MKGKSEFFKTNLIYFSTMVLFVVLRICSAMGVFSFLGETQGLILTLITQVGLMFLIPFGLFCNLNKTQPKETLRRFNFRKIDFKTVLVSILIGLIVFVLNIFISSFFSSILNFFGYSSSSGGVQTDTSWGNFFYSLLTVAILPAFCEEFIHRGMLLSSYNKLGFKKAVLISGVMFGLIHLNVGQFFYATIIGFILAIVTLYSQSIVPAMIIHFLNNGISVYLSFAEAKGIWGKGFYSGFSKLISSGNLVSNIIFVTLLVALLISILFFLVNWLLKNNIKRTVINFSQNMTLLAMREEVLSEIQPEQKQKNPPIVFGGGLNPTKLTIPYEMLGFYMEPVVKPSKIDKVFYYSCFVLGGLVTLFTFIWGIL